MSNASHSTTDLFSAESFVSDPVASDPVASDPVASDPVASDPVASDPVAGEPIASDPAFADPGSGNPFATSNLPRTVAFARCPSLAEALVRYDVNDSLLRARLREARITPALQLRCSEFPDPLVMLAVVDFELPDLVGVLPLWQQMAHASPRAELRVIGDDEMPLLEHILNGDAGIDLETLELPLLLLLDEEYQLQAQWGPRPQAAEAHIEEWLGEHPEFERLAEDGSAEGATAFAALNLDLTRSMRIWYNSGLDKEASNELERLLAGLQGDSGNGSSDPSALPPSGTLAATDDAEA